MEMEAQTHCSLGTSILRCGPAQDILLSHYRKDQMLRLGYGTYIQRLMIMINSKAPLLSWQGRSSLQT